MANKKIPVFKLGILALSKLLCKYLKIHSKLKIIFLTFLKKIGDKQKQVIKIAANMNWIDQIFLVLLTKYIVSIVPGVTPIKVADINSNGPTFESPQ